MGKPFSVKPPTGKDGKPLQRCPFPNCGSLYAPEPGKAAACLKHRQLIEDVMFIVNRIKWATPTGAPPGAGEATKEEPPKEKGAKLYIPNPGMGDKAIEEAKRAAGRTPPPR